MTSARAGSSASARGSPSDRTDIARKNGGHPPPVLFSAAAGERGAVPRARSRGWGRIGYGAWRSKRPRSDASYAETAAFPSAGAQAGRSLSTGETYGPCLTSKKTVPPRARRRCGPPPRGSPRRRPRPGRPGGASSPRRAPLRRRERAPGLLSRRRSSRPWEGRVADAASRRSRARSRSAAGGHGRPSRADSRSRGAADGVGPRP